MSVTVEYERQGDYRGAIVLIDSLHFSWNPDCTYIRVAPARIFCGSLRLFTAIFDQPTFDFLRFHILKEQEKRTGR